jgi:hypothetical protein
VSLIPTIYSSTDPGAPQLTGQVGAMLSVLRAILVTGYGTTPNVKAPLGWTEEFTGANKAVFRNNPVTGTGVYVRVVDDGSAAAGSSARSASLRCYKLMSDIDTGVDAAPMVSQLANGAIWGKSVTLDATARAWWAIGNERCLYLFVAQSGLALSAASPHFVGDFVSYKPGDAYNYFVETPNVTSYDGNTSITQSRLFVSPVTLDNTPSAGSAACPGYFGRSYTAAVGALLAITLQTADRANTSGALGGDAHSMPYPPPVNGALWVDRARLGEGGAVIRGILPGIYVPMHVQPFADLANVSDLAGLPPGLQLLAKSFRSFYIHVPTYRGQVLFDIVNPW